MQASCTTTTTLHLHGHSNPFGSILQGVIVNAPVRDSAAMRGMALGVKALGTCPLKSDKAAADQGTAQVPVTIQVSAQLLASLLVLLLVSLRNCCVSWWHCCCVMQLPLLQLNHFE